MDGEPSRRAARRPGARACQAAGSALLIVSAVSMPWIRYNATGGPAHSLGAGPLSPLLAGFGVAGLVLTAPQLRRSHTLTAALAATVGLAAFAVSVVAAAGRMAHINTILVTSSHGSATAYAFGFAVALIAAVLILLSAGLEATGSAQHAGPPTARAAGNRAMQFGVVRGVDVFPAAGAVLAAIMVWAYFVVMHEQGNQPLTWAAAALVAGGASGAYGAFSAAPLRSLVLAFGGAVLGGLGLLAILTIGLPILVAAGLIGAGLLRALLQS